MGDSRDAGGGSRESAKLPPHCGRMPRGGGAPMSVIQALFAFVAAATILTITPGVDTAMVLRSAASGGPRPAVFAAIGISAGCLVWGAAVSVGLGALLAASPLAFTLVKWAGAAYLLYLGAKLILRPRDRFDAAA